MEVVGWAFALVLFGGVVFFALRAQKVEREAGETQQRLAQELAHAQQQAAHLARYQSIPNAEAYAAQLQAAAEHFAAERRAEGTRAAQQGQSDAQRALAGAEMRARQVLESATSRASDVTREADARAHQTVESANARASEVTRSADMLARQVVDAANVHAKEIAGEALAAVREARSLEQTARAMRNVIEGYGDAYLVPIFGVLDELGEEVGFAEAGQRLKTARERMRRMIKAGQTATCDYVEEVRRTTAIEFVTDAFNGKVDSILWDVRHDNYGTLLQKVKDAFALVNKNGQAFRNARIEKEYLDVRLDELKWAVAAHELKQIEREEQRALKERIREEERAQKEFERAMKEASKEEDVLRKAMAKAQVEIERATAGQRDKYEAQLAELAAKLRAAEEKNQRALSMAQQTKAGHVYVISNVGSFGEHVYKIGLTRRLEPLDRIRELGDASVPFEFDVHALIRCEDAPAMERELHRRFLKHQVNKVNARKEFFRADIRDIRQIAESLGCQAGWTMTAEGREYQETLAIERAMQTSTLDEAAWAERQLKEHDAAMVDVVRSEGELAMAG